MFDALFSIYIIEPLKSEWEICLLKLALIGWILLSISQ